MKVIFGKEIQISRIRNNSQNYSEKFNFNVNLEDLLVKKNIFLHIDNY